MHVSSNDKLGVKSVLCSHTFTDIHKTHTHTQESAVTHQSEMTKDGDDSPLGWVNCDACKKWRCVDPGARLSMVHFPATFVQLCWLSACVLVPVTHWMRTCLNNLAYKGKLKQELLVLRASTETCFLHYSLPLQHTLTRCRQRTPILCAPLLECHAVCSGKPLLFFTHAHTDTDRLKAHTHARTCAPKIKQAQK